MPETPMQLLLHTNLSLFNNIMMQVKWNRADMPPRSSICYLLPNPIKRVSALNRCAVRQFHHPVSGLHLKISPSDSKAHHVLVASWCSVQEGTGGAGRTSFRHERASLVIYSRVCPWIPPNAVALGHLRKVVIKSLTFVQSHETKGSISELQNSVFHPRIAY